MKDPNFEMFEALRKRAVEIGNADDTTAHRELLALLRSPYPIVRKSAAGAFGDANATWNERIVLDLKSCGITDAEIETFRAIMLEK